MFKSAMMTSVILLSAAAMVDANALPNEHRILIAPNCIKLKQTHQLLATNKNYSLIETNEEGVIQLNEASKVKHTSSCGKFMDVTEEWQHRQKNGVNFTNSAEHFLAGQLKKYKRASLKSYQIQYESTVNPLLKSLNPQNMWENLTVLSQFPDRYSRSQHGIEAAAWIKKHIEDLAKKTNHHDVKVYYVATGDYYKQPSIVAKFGEGNAPGVVIGGHIDTLSSTWELKPGADDDGTGTVTVMETARILLESGVKFKKPIYFVWYAAEEMGLVGSSYVVKDFKKKNIPVEAVLQLDMTGYAYKNEPTMWLVSDYVDKHLTTFLQSLIKVYVKQPVQLTTCGYACSDHANWDKVNIPAAFPFEAAFNHDNPDIHTAKDTMDKISLTHMTNYAKLALAFAVEIAEPTG